MRSLILALFIGTSMAAGHLASRVCQKEGCWVVLEEDGASARVMFADHAFSVPKDAVGNAIVHGTLEVAPVDAGQARHLEEDGAAAPARLELRIVATGIHIFDPPDA